MMVAKPKGPAGPSAGDRLIKALAEDDDPYELTFLIEQAALHADYIERLRWLLNGDLDSWLSLKIGAKTVSVVVNDPLREARQQAEQLRRLLNDIYKRRALIPGGFGDDALDDD